MTLETTMRLISVVFLAGLSASESCPALLMMFPAMICCCARSYADGDVRNGRRLTSGMLASGKYPRLKSGTYKLKLHNRPRARKGCVSRPDTARSCAANGLRGLPQLGGAVLFMLKVCQP